MTDPPHTYCTLHFGSRKLRHPSNFPTTPLICTPHKPVADAHSVTPPDDPRTPAQPERMDIPDRRHYLHLVRRKHDTAALDRIRSAVVRDSASNPVRLRGTADADAVADLDIARNLAGNVDSPPDDVGIVDFVDHRNHRRTHPHRRTAHSRDSSPSLVLVLVLVHNHPVRPTCFPNFHHDDAPVLPCDHRMPSRYLWRIRSRYSPYYPDPPVTTRHSAWRPMRRQRVEARVDERCRRFRGCTGLSGGRTW